MLRFCTMIVGHKTPSCTFGCYTQQEAPVNDRTRSVGAHLLSFFLKILKFVYFFKVKFVDYFKILFPRVVWLVDI